MNAKDSIIVALDVDSFAEAWSLVKDLAPHVGCFKVGLELFTSVGTPQVIRFLHDLGVKVFYDGKFNDIPNTVGRSARAVSSLGVAMFNIHASTGQKSIEAAVFNKGNSLVLGVTVLTSIDECECVSIFGDKPGPKVLQFSHELLKAGVDGIICSPQELKLLGIQTEFKKLLKIIPGTRPEWALAGDQKRTMTPGDAIIAGATALVIGRPITKPPKEIGGPINAVRLITDEISTALNQLNQLSFSQSFEE